MKFIFDKKKFKDLDLIVLRKQNRPRECMAKRVYWLNGFMRFIFSKFDRVKLWVALGSGVSFGCFQSVRIILLV